MRIVRFSPGPNSGLGTDPLFGLLEEDGTNISVIAGDPIYAGVSKTGAVTQLSDVRLLAPVIPRSKVVCIGKNYADHAAEMGSVVPDEPIIFLKANTTIIGPGDTIVWPAMAPTIDYEAELAIVIGKGGLMLKTIGVAARKDIEELLKKQVYLELFVKVEADWRNREYYLKNYGYKPAQNE